MQNISGFCAWHNELEATCKLQQSCSKLRETTPIATRRPVAGMSSTSPSSASKHSPRRVLPNSTCSPAPFLTTSVQHIGRVAQMVAASSRSTTTLATAFAASSAAIATSSTFAQRRRVQPARNAQTRITATFVSWRRWLQSADFQLLLLAFRHVARNICANIARSLFARAIGQRESRRR